MAFCEVCHLVGLEENEICARCKQCFDCCSCQEEARASLIDEHDHELESEFDDDDEAELAALEDVEDDGDDYAE